MADQDQPLTDYSWAKSRSDIITLYWDKQINDSQLTSKYREWRDTNVYLLLIQKMSPLDQPLKHRLIKASRRGNDVYRYRCRQRFKPTLEICEKHKNEPLIDHNTRTGTSRFLFITLTWNPSLCLNDVHDSWRAFPTLLNEFYSKLEYEYGAISEIRCFETFKNGFPHAHLCVVFQDHNFRTHRYVAEHGKNKGKIRYLISDHDNENISEFWFGQHVTIEAIQSYGAIPYIIKYITKTQHELNGGSTSAKLWLYDMRSYSISKDFNDSINELQPEFRVQLDTIMRNSKRITPESYNDSEYMYSRTVNLSKNAQLWSFDVADPPPLIKTTTPNEYEQWLSDFYTWHSCVHQPGEIPPVMPKFSESHSSFTDNGYLGVNYEDVS